jgi:hypothetical protein
MAITIDATVGGSSSNSFVTEVEQIAYMETRLNNSDWTTVSGSALTDDENKALVESSRELSAEAWKGRRVTSTQALSWPRDNVQNPDDPNLDYYDDTVIPQRVKDATMELAFQYIKAGTTDVAALSSSRGIKRDKIETLEVEYFEHTGGEEGLQRYPRIWGWIAPLLAYPSGLTSPLVRG